MLLESIRADFARPTVHARNLWHSSMLMWDVWAMDSAACPAFLGQDLGGFVAAFDEFTPATDVETAGMKPLWLRLDLLAATTSTWAFWATT